MSVSRAKCRPACGNRAGSPLVICSSPSQAQRRDFQHRAELSVHAQRMPQKPGSKMRAELATQGASGAENVPCVRSALCTRRRACKDTRLDTCQSWRMERGVVMARTGAGRGCPALYSKRLLYTRRSDAQERAGLGDGESARSSNPVAQQAACKRSPQQWRCVGAARSFRQQLVRADRPSRVRALESWSRAEQPARASRAHCAGTGSESRKSPRGALARPRRAEPRERRTTKRCTRRRRGAAPARNGTQPQLWRVHRRAALRLLGRAAPESPCTS